MTTITAPGSDLHGAGARLVAAADSDRRRLERDLHDGPQQRLVALSLMLRTIALRADGESAQLLGAAQQELAAALKELRELANGLHPEVLTAHGLAAGLESVVARAPVPVELSVDLPGRLSEALEVAAYYLVSEALTNVAKYAHATGATVTVALEAGELVVEIADDGIGGADASRGSGLRGLADRVGVAGGRLRVVSPLGGGTRLRAELPLG